VCAVVILVTVFARSSVGINANITVDFVARTLTDLMNGVCMSDESDCCCCCDELNERVLQSSYSLNVAAAADDEWIGLTGTGGIVVGITALPSPVHAVFYAVRKA
jgi:hypothetical protein